MNFVFYGLLLIGVGVIRLYRDAKARGELHAHRCGHCGAVWRHSGDNARNDADQLAAHTCPRCGAEQWRVMREQGAPSPTPIADALGVRATPSAPPADVPRNTAPAGPRAPGGGPAAEGEPDANA